ncbi:MAG: hypothetical protein HJJLKODD_00178 [Phycisphaerae bacterium]|nr:hypothetical protein [Phycisphaerae bacterium]
MTMFMPGCKKETALDITIESENATQRIITVNGIAMTIDIKVPFKYVLAPSTERRESTAAEGLGFAGPGQLESSPPKSNTKIKAQSATINNQSLKLANGGLMLGSKGYGLVKVGDKVEINMNGVTINGQNRGTLP